MFHLTSSLRTAFNRSAVRASQPRVGSWLAISVVAAGLGVSMQLHAAQGNPPATAVLRNMLAATPDWSAIGQLGENGDGTAFTFVFTPVGPDEILGTLTLFNSDYSIATHFPKGQSGNGTGSGVGHFTCEGMVMNTVTWEMTGPFPVSVDMAVTSPTTLSASMFQGVTTETNPLTGELSIVRKHTIGSQADGQTAGALTIRIDGTVVADSTGGLGMTSIENVLSLQRIR